MRVSLLAAAIVGSAVADIVVEQGETKFGDADRFPVEIDPNTGNEVCSSGLYLGAGVPTNLHQILGNDNFVTLGPNEQCSENIDVSYNAIGYNVIDHFLYAVTDHQNDEDNHHVVRISQHGCVELVADIGPLPDVSNNKHIAGDIFDNTLWASSSDKFRAITLPTTTLPGMSMTEWTFDKCDSMNDFAFAGSAFIDASGVPAGTAFGFNIETQSFCSFRSISNGAAYPEPKSHGNLGVSAQMGDNAKVGGFFMDKDGAVYLYDNNVNRLFKYSGLAAFLKGETTELTFEYSFELAEANSDNVDGAACPEAAAPLECLSLDKRCCETDSLII